MVVKCTASGPQTRTFVDASGKTYTLTTDNADIISTISVGQTCNLHADAVRADGVQQPGQEK